MYGTAWKEDLTRELTVWAIEAGFRAVDTANQRRHYHEVGVGEAISEVLERGLVKREDLFLQTKFTYASSQDHRVPFDLEAEPSEQVRQSLASSLEHLGTDRMDSYILHGPSTPFGLAETDLVVWKAMEDAKREGMVRHIGVSNVNAEQLATLLQEAEVRPAFVQNRTFARTGWDLHVRRLCRHHGMVYQGFSLLTANPQVLADPRVQAIADRLDVTPAQVIFVFARQAGMLPLTGTTDLTHMRQDLETVSLELSDEEVALIEGIGVH
jgi:diketogulonate reductase-like aldo/keto reductase